MTARVLIVSPDAGFGGLIQQTLEKVGSYEPVLVSTGRQALELAEKISLDLAILDADTRDLSYIDLGLTLQASDPDTRILLIPSDETVKNIEIKGLRISGYLTKPFYLPDLVEIVDGTLAEDDEIEEPDFTIPETSIGDAMPTENQVEFKAAESGFDADAAPKKPWLSDVDKAAQHLARLSLSTSAQAALILNRGELWAYAGQLSKAAAQELAQIVQQDWKRGAGVPGEGNVDLARFIRLNATGGEYLLYATLFEGSMILALAFDTRTPFSKIHHQASHLVRALVSPPEAEPEIMRDPAQESEEGTISQEPSAQPEQQMEIEDKEWYWEFETESEDIPVVARDHEETARVEGIDLPADAPPEGVPANTGLAPAILPEPKPDEEATKPVRVKQTLPRDLRSNSPMIYDINYACVLLPRLPEHHLTGDLSEHLAVWMRRLSLAFGWRLEHLAVRPGWLQWIVCVAPETSPVHVVQLVREKTSQLIFAEFPRYSIENPSSDFWAPGYLVVTSTNPISGELVQEYIEQTRLRQGIQIGS